MKKILILLFSLLYLLNTDAQPIRKSLADKNFKRFQYAEALHYYLEVINKDTGNAEVKEKLATCYRKLNNSVGAELWYRKLQQSGNTTPVNKLYFAQALAKNKKYAEASEWYRKYAAGSGSDLRGNAFANAYSDMSQFYKDSAKYRIKSLPFNSTQLDFSPMYYDKGLIFCTNRDRFSMVKNMFVWDYSNYLDLYYTSSDSSQALKLPGDINTKYHEGPIAFTKTKDTAIFTRTNYYHGKLGKSTDNIHKLKLYMCVKKNGKWEKIYDLPFNNDEYSVGHPCFSPDGKKLFFISDMPGGCGETDIYVVDYYNASWGTPVNLGKTINTEGKEMFPYVDSQNNLYYASDGLPGLGGLDVFCALYNNGKYEKPFNIGSPINSNTDDFGIVFNDAANKGYFTSDRGANGDDDIYKFEKIGRALIFYVYDADTKKPLNKVQLTIINLDKKENKKSDSLGKASGTYPENTGLTVYAEKELYYPDTLKYTGAELDKLTIVNIPLKKKEVILSFAGHVITEQDKKPVAGAKASLQDENGKVLKTAVSDANGDFTFPLEQEKKYKIVVTVVESGQKCSDAKKDVATIGLVESTILTATFPILCVGDIIKIENIYYDFDKYNIRADAAIELDKLVTIMKTYPKMKIELRSHTDCRGTSTYNYTLSTNRAISAMDYLISKGISSDRMTAHGYGESMLVNKCADGVKCTEEEHQMNRRTEFKIISIY